jgi:hypothetical protein
MQDRALVFQHIPKTGGTTLACVVYGQYAHDKIFFFGHWPRTAEGLQLFVRLPGTIRNSFQAFLGHQPFGIHEYLDKPVTYITLLRDPVERVISHYYHRYRKKNPAVECSPAPQPLITVDNYMVSDPYWHNWQCRFLHGPADRFAPNGDGQRVLEEVKANIERHSVLIGLTERFDESLVLFKLALGWDHPAYTKMNVGNGRPGTEEQPEEALNAVRACNGLDVELYDFVHERFQRQIRSYGRLFVEELNGFRAVQRERLQEDRTSCCGSDRVRSRLQSDAPHNP